MRCDLCDAPSYLHNCQIPDRHSLGCPNGPLPRMEQSAIALMRHAVDRRNQNRFCAEVGLIDWSQWCGLVVLGLAEAGHVINEGRDQYFHVTEAGRKYLARVDKGTQ